MRYILLPIRKIKYPINIVFERRNNKKQQQKKKSTTRKSILLSMFFDNIMVSYITHYISQPSIRPSIRGRCFLVFDKTLFLYNSINTWIVVWRVCKPSTFMRSHKAILQEISQNICEMMMMTIVMDSEADMVKSKVWKNLDQMITLTLWVFAVELAWECFHILQMTHRISKTYSILKISCDWYIFI